MLDIKRNQMVGTIIDIVRNACYEQGISHGAIGVGVALAKKNRVTFDWSEAPESAALELTIAPITSGDDTLCYDENGKITEDGAGTVAMKIAGLRRLLTYYDEEQVVVIKRFQYTSAAMPDQMVIPGLSKQMGAIAIEIGMLVGGFCAYYGECALTFYVAVSGGTEEQNEAAAWSALKYVDDEVQKDPTLSLARAYYA